MSTNTGRPTAVIYEFPIRNPRVSGFRHDDRTALDARQQRLPTVEFGSGWYHDAAIRDAERPRKP
jgi:uncharacterized protein DUF2735